MDSNQAERQRTLLIVDDSAELIEWMKFDLEARGFTVFSALSGEECIDVLESVNPPCVLLDVMMPGSPALTRFLEQHPIILSEGSILLDESTFCEKDYKRRTLYEVLCEEALKWDLLRDKADRPLVFQRLKTIHEIVSSAHFVEQHGEAHIHLDGYTTCQLITSCPHYKNVSIILFTAGGPGTKNERVQRAFRVGACDYVLKSEYYTSLFERLEQYT